MQLRAMGSGAVPSGPTQLMMSIGLGKKPDEHLWPTGRS